MPPPFTNLPDDVLFHILSRASSGPADFARCAATCRRWARVVAAHAAAISRALPPPGRFLPPLALGFFHQENDDAGAGRRARGRRASVPLRFVPAASASRLLGPFAGGAHLPADADGARPVASRNGCVVLELRREARGDWLALCVWNPMTGDVAVLPPLSGQDNPGYYACAILTGNDLDDVLSPPTPRRSPDFFRLLLVYNRRGYTALRSFSSDAGGWGPEGRKPGAKIAGHMLRQLGPAVVLRGVAYWPMFSEAFGVRVPDAADHRVLGVSSDGASLRYVDVGFVARTLLCFTSSDSQLRGADYKSPTGGFWDDVLDQHIRVPQIEVSKTTTVKLRWFGERSGTLIFTVGDEEAAGGAGAGAVFALNWATRSLEKLADGVGYHACRNLCGFEMDRAGLIASTLAL
ncbi:hypothetical protein ACP4OV_003219 [Aristida adscensionis]